MRKPRFLEGVVIALIFSATGSVVYSVLSRFYSDTQTWCYLIAVLSFVYCIYLLKRSQQHAGRIIVMMCWLAITALMWVVKPLIWEFALINLGVIWLLRCFYYHSCLITSVLDLGLIVLSLITALWALFQSNSVFLGLWCFFLVQALFVTIPNIRKSKVTQQAKANNTMKFGHALRLAQSAVDTLARQTSS